MRLQKFSKRISIIIALFLFFGVTGAQSTAVSDSTREDARVARLAGLAKVWGAVKFFHPFPAYREIDWDKALIDTLPKASAAKSPEEYAAALNSMFSVLNDSQTKAFAASEKPQAENKTDGKEPLRLENGVLYYNVLAAARITSSQGNEKSDEFAGNFLKLAAQAKTILIDARIAGETDEGVLYEAFFQQQKILPVMLDRKVTLGTIRYRMHNGYAPQFGSTSGDYYSAFVTDAPETFGSEKPFKTPPLVVIVDPNSSNAKIYSGLQAAGKAFVVAESGDLGASLDTINLSDGVTVKVRMREIVAPDGSIGFAPDALAPKGEAVETAQKIIAENKFVSVRPKTPGAVSNAAQISQKDLTYAAMEFPAAEYRLLGLFRFWNVINYFYPYKNLTGTNWNTILPKYIAKFEANKTAIEYQMTVREMVAEIQDSHGGVRNGNASAQYLGNFLPPFAVRFVENQTVVVAVFDDKLPIKKGDVILTVDGEDIAKLRASYARIIAASTPQALMRGVHYNLLRGQKDSVAKLTLRGADGKIRAVEIPRSLDRNDAKFLEAENRKTPVYSILPGGAAYVDLDRLQNGEVDKMFDAIKNAPAVIFDMRGYPNGTAWTVAPRLTDKIQPVAALFDNPITDGKNFDSDENAVSANFMFAQRIPKRETGAVYKGKIVMLIDEYAVSQAEHTCLFFESARPDITFIGTPTTGANGDVTNLVLPGNLIVSFSGHSVRHADNRQLQRVGIQPNIKVAPTIRGITQGKDEILDAAVKFLRSDTRK